MHEIITIKPVATGFKENFIQNRRGQYENPNENEFIITIKLLGCVSGLSRPPRSRQGLSGVPETPPADVKTADVP